MILIHNGIKKTVEIEKNINDYTLTIDNQKINVSITKFSDNCILIDHFNETKKYFFAKSGKYIYVNSDGFSTKLEIVDEDEEKQYDFENITGNKDIIKAPMPGSIVKVIVESGQKVKEGEPLIIVEAMKMETTLYSSIDGIVKELNTQAGEQVDSDKVLLIIERE